jgi:hypothetical protein
VVRELAEQDERAVAETTTERKRRKHCEPATGIPESTSETKKSRKMTMATRQLRSKKALNEAEENKSALELPHAQLLCVHEMDARPSGPDLSEKDKNYEIAAVSGGGEGAEILQNNIGTNEQRQTQKSQESDLRNIIKEVLREEREKFVRLRQQEMEEMFERLMDKSAAKSTADLERLDSKLTNSLEGETGKLVQKISSLQEDTYQESSRVSSEIERVDEQTKESLSVSLRSHKLEAKRDHDKVLKELSYHKQKMQNKFDTIHADISKISQYVTEEGLSNVEGKLEEITRKHVEFRLGESAFQLDQLGERIVAVRSEAARPSADSRPVTISSEGAGPKNTVPVSAPSISSQLQSDCGHDNDNLSIHVPADVVDASKTSHVNEIEGVHVQCRNSFMDELPLPKFTDCKKQNIISFLDELDNYFLLKSVPEKVKLAMAIGSISDT